MPGVQFDICLNGNIHSRKENKHRWHVTKILGQNRTRNFWPSDYLSIFQIHLVSSPLNWSVLRKLIRQNGCSEAKFSYGNIHVLIGQTRCLGTNTGKSIVGWPVPRKSSWTLQLLGLSLLSLCSLFSLRPLLKSCCNSSGFKTEFILVKWIVRYVRQFLKTNKHYPINICPCGRPSPYLISTPPASLPPLAWRSQGLCVLSLRPLAKDDDTLKSPKSFPKSKRGEGTDRTERGGVYWKTAEWQTRCTCLFGNAAQWMAARCCDTEIKQVMVQCSECSRRNGEPEIKARNEFFLCECITSAQLHNQSTCFCVSPPRRLRRWGGGAVLWLQEVWWVSFSCHWLSETAFTRAQYRQLNAYVGIFFMYFPQL